MGRVFQMDPKRVSLTQPEYDKMISAIKAHL